MFLFLDNIEIIDILNFDSSNVKSMKWMFFRCDSLKSLNLSRFNTSSVTDMTEMFFRCSSLLSLDLRFFNTSSVRSMSRMFGGCSSLLSLDLRSFNTSSVTDMSFMFGECSSLLSLDLGSFNTSSVRRMEYMFSYCSSLKSLNIERFDVSSVFSLKYIFSGCSSLISLNLSNFYSISYTDNITGIFDNCNPNLKYCINENKAYNYWFRNSLKNFEKNCSEICITMNKKKYIKDKYLCIDNCSSDALYKYENNSICYKEFDDTTNTSIYPIRIINRYASPNKINSSKLIFIIIGVISGVVLIIIIVLIVLYKKNIICTKKKELHPSKNNNPIPNETSETKCDIFNREENIMKMPKKIKVIFNDNKNRYEIYIDPETTMEELIAVYYSENNIKIKNKLFLCGGKNILIESIKEKIKEFNKHNDENEVTISVSEIDIS